MTECTAGEQAFAGGYVLLGSLLTLSVIHEVSKLIHRYKANGGNGLSLNRCPKWLFWISFIFLFLCILTLIKCILYGLVHCNYIYLSDSFKYIVFNIIFIDLYGIQLYFLWIVLLIRLYFTFKNTRYQLNKLTVKIYCIIFISLPLLFPSILLSSFYDIFIVLSFSFSIFITLSIIIIYCFKLFQVYRYNSNYKLTKEYQQYIHKNDLDLLTIITKTTILTLISTLFSFLILLVLIFIFVFNVYSINIKYQQQLLDICLLLDTYITSICVILQFKYLHSKYVFCCSCIDVICRFYCNKYLNNDPNMPIPRGIVEENRISIALHSPRHNGKNYHNHNPPNAMIRRKQRVMSDTDNNDQSGYYSNSDGGYISSDDEVLSQPLKKKKKGKSTSINGAELQMSVLNGKNKQTTASQTVITSTTTSPSRRNNTIYSDTTIEVKAINHQQRSSIHRTLFQNVNRVTIQNILIKERGFDKRYTKRAMAVYEVWFLN